MADLTKLALHSDYPAFKNNDVYGGSFSISGVTAGGTNTITATFVLPQAPDLLDVVFSGRSVQEYTNRPDGAWFKQGFVEVRGDNAGAGFNDFTTTWTINSKLSGTTLTITATNVQTFTDVLTLTASTVYYKLVDYSAF